MKRIKILFLINSLGGGGAERVLVNLVNNMDKSKFDITVETMFADGNYIDFLDKDLNYISKKTPCPPGVSRMFKLIPASLLYRFFVGHRKYDILVAYMHGAPTKVISGCYDKTMKTVTWLHYGDPSKGSFFKFWLSKKIAIAAYDSFDAVVGVSNSVTEAFGDYTKIKNGLYTIYNTNDSEHIRLSAKENNAFEKPDGKIVMCTVGRLVPQKGYDRLIEIAKRLNNEGYSFEILIMGTGKQEKLLKEKISEYNAQDYIKLLGFQKNPYSIMAKTDLYVLSSREEGLATVLTEALFLGLPIVATDVSGTKEVLGENNEYGLVVENSTEGLYHGLKKILDDPELLSYYKSKSKERAAYFETSKTVKDTEAFFEDLLGE